MRQEVIFCDEFGHSCTGVPRDHYEGGMGLFGVEVMQIGGPPPERTLTQHLRGGK